MRSRSNSAFSLLEVLIATAILSTAVIFIFRSFVTALSAVKLSQNITLAGYLAEDKLWEIGQAYRLGAPLTGSGSDNQGYPAFNWSYEISDTDMQDLKELRLTLSWQQGRQPGEYSLGFLSYLSGEE